MKAEIKNDGTLYINAETELESYALKTWYREWGQGKPSVLAVAHNGEWPLSSTDSKVHAIVKPQ